MSVHRVSALGRALLFVIALVLTALGSSAHAQLTNASREHSNALREQPAFESRDALPADDVRAGEQLELVSTSLRSAPRPPAAGNALTAPSRGPRTAPGADAPRWCDVVQCRRLGGALLLGFATPPPARN